MFPPKTYGGGGYRPLNQGELDDHALYHEPVQAWRWWRLEGLENRRPILASVFKEEVTWPYLEPMVAECKGGSCNDGKPSPHAGGQCGIYAVNNGLQFIEREINSAYGGVPSCVGILNMWGRIVVGERGFKSQFAYPSRLFLPTSVPTALAGGYSHFWCYASPSGTLNVANTMAFLYGVPVEIVSGDRLHELIKTSQLPTIPSQRSEAPRE